jgi:hypothetical protein
VPCDCIGSCKFIHLLCLRSWTDSKLTVVDECGVASYFWENLECEICKQGFEINSVLPSGEMVSILEYKKPTDDPYMIWESNVSGATKAIHVINFAINQSLMIGRRATNEISISDISVSREQAMLRYDSNTQEITLTDLNSKFGTYVRIDGLFALPSTEEMVPINIERKCFFIYNTERFNPIEMCL